MATSVATGQGVAAVILPRFLNSGDPRKNCEKFIQSFKDWCELNGWYDSDPPPQEGEESEAQPVWRAKGKTMAALRSAIAGNGEVENLLQGLQLTGGQEKEPEIVLRCLQEHFAASEGVLTERTKFAQMKQDNQESVTAWEGRVREQGRRLEYCNKCEDQLLRDKFICGINNDKLLSKLLDKGHRDKVTKDVVSFKAMVQIAKNFEQCEKAKAVMQQAKGPAEQVNFAGSGQSVSGGNKVKSKFSKQEDSASCQFCAGPTHPRSVCPARDKRCAKKGCGRMGHFARCCRMGKPPPRVKSAPKPQAHQLDTDDTEQGYPEDYDPDLYEVELKPQKYSESIYSTNETNKALGRKFFSNLKLCVVNSFKSVKVQLDTASTCNTLPESIAKSLIPRGTQLGDFLSPSKATLFTYSNSQIKPVGKLELLAETATGYHLLTFHVIRDSLVQNKPPLLSGSDCVKLGLVKIHADEIHSVMSSPVTNSPKPLRKDTPPLVSKTAAESKPVERMFDVSSPNSTRKQMVTPGKINLKWVLETFADVHKGLGQFGRPISFDLDPSVTPVHDAIHRQPVARHIKIKEELDRMEEEGKICRQYEPTAWCSNMTVRETPDKFRICLDPSNTINKAIRVPKHPIPRFEDILPQLKGAKCFSVADAMSGFTNIPLDSKSSLATTFHTPFGRYRWLRLPYGVSSGPEEYQARQQEALAGLKGICNIADDVLIYGCGETQEEAEKDHDENLYNFLLRMRQVKLKLNSAM